jgi:hypothetical protein
LSQSKVGQKSSIDPFFKKHIGWFHIAMDESLGMGCGQPSRQLLADA